MARLRMGSPGCACDHNVGVITRQRSPLVGRDDVLGRFGDAVASARVGHPAMVLVSGEAGIGKTRLVSEASRHVAGDDVLLHGNAVDLAHGEMPFGILSSSLRSLVRSHGLDVVRGWAGTDAGCLSILVRELAPESDLVREPILVIDAFRGLLSRLSSTRLVWWSVDDLQWADSVGRDAVRYVVQLMQPPERLLVSCTLRTHDRSPSAATSSFLAELVRAPQALQIGLERLAPDLVEVQFAALHDGQVTRALLERVVALSDGVPFLVEELVAGGLTASGPLPSSAEEVMLARLATLDPRAQLVVNTASLAQNHLQDRWLERVTALEPRDLEEALKALVQAGVLDLDSAHEGYQFHHALMREAVSAAMLPAERTRWHRRWAHVLSDNDHQARSLASRVEIAHHWAAAGIDVRAFESAIDAAHAAELMGAQEERAVMLCAALRVWQRVDNETRSGIDIDDIVEEASWSCLLSGRTDLGLEMLSHQMAAPDETEDAELRALRLTLIQDRFALDPAHQPRLNNGAMLDDQIAILRRSRRSPLWARALADLVARSDDAECSTKLDALLTEAVATVGFKPSSFDYIDLQDVRSHHLMVLGHHAEGADLTLDVARQARGHVPLSQLVRLESNAVSHLYHVGRFHEAAELGRQSTARISDPRLSPRLWSLLAGNLATTLIETGDWAEAEFYLDRIQNVAPTGLAAADALINTARLSCRRGDLVAAERTLDGALRSNITGDVKPGSPSFRDVVAAELSLSKGGATDAWALLSPIATAGTVLNPAFMRDTLLLATRALADAMHSPAKLKDRMSDAGVDDLRRAVTRLPSIGEMDHAWRAPVQVELARCLGIDTQEEWAHAITASERLGQPYEHVQALLGLARRALEDRMIDVARPALEQALAIGQRLGARLLVDAVREAAGRGRIRLAGDEERRGSGDGMHGLTGREIDVLRLLAEGYRNDQIGAALFISPKTASVHVSRILAKLGVSSRGEAAAWAHRKGLFVDHA